MPITAPVDQARTEAVKYLFAVAGATDAALDLARSYAADAQRRTQQGSERITSLVSPRRLPDLDPRDFDFKGAQAELEAWLADVQKRLAKVELPKVELPKVELPKLELSAESLRGLSPEQVRDTVNDSIADLARDARAAQARIETLVADLQKDAQSLPTRLQAQLTDALADLGAAYDDLAARGEQLVQQIRKQGIRKVATAKLAEPKAPKALKAPAKKGTAKKAPAKKAAAKKSTAKKAPAKKTAAKKTTAKKTPAKKTAAKKSTAKKAPAKKA